MPQPALEPGKAIVTFPEFSGDLLSIRALSRGNDLEHLLHRIEVVAESRKDRGDRKAWDRERLPAN